MVQSPAEMAGGAAGRAPCRVSAWARGLRASKPHWISVIGLAQAPLDLPSLAGALVMPIPPLLVAHGPADAAGELHLAVTLPPLPPGIQAVNVYAPAAAVSAVGAAVLGAPSQLSIL